MVEVFKIFQQPNIQSLCHDVLFHCRFLFVFCLWYFKQTVILFIVFSCFTAWSLNVWLVADVFSIFSLSCWFLCITSLAVTSSIIKTSVKFWGTSLNSGYASVHRWNSLRKALLKTIKWNETRDCLKAHRAILSYVNKIYNR